MAGKLTEQIAGMLNGTMRDRDGLLRRVEDKPTVGFKRLTESATIPTKAHASDSGFDLYASEDIIIEPGETAVVPTGIAVQLPKGMGAQVRPRSGVTSKTKLRVQLGTIDNDYRGDIGVIVDNISEIPDEDESYNVVKFIRGYDAGRKFQDEPEGTYAINKGDRIAQLVVQYLPQVRAVEIDGDLTDTDRGDKGYGSSGYTATCDDIDCVSIVCSECGEEKDVEYGTWALDKGMCEKCYCAYQGG